MRISLVLLLCFIIVVVNSATTKTTSRRAVVTTDRATTKAPTPKSAYAYLRSVRGKKSCSSGSCPFWERHGRSFAALRCYSQQYQECTCLHRMCFSSCMFTRSECNAEMVSCLKQICPRCMPASASAMCAVYDSMATRVAEALSVFACYPCCPNLNGASATNNTNTAQPTSTTPVSTTIIDEFFAQTTTEDLAAVEYPGIGNQPINGGGLPGTNQNGQPLPSNTGNNGAFTNGNSAITNNGGAVPGNGAATNNGGAVPSNGAITNNGVITNNGGVVPGNGVYNGNSGSNGNVATNGNTANGVYNGNSGSNGNVATNGNTANGAINGNGNGFSGNCNPANIYPGVVFPGSNAIFYGGLPNRNQQAVKQRARQTLRTTKRRLLTTRRTPVTTRRLTQTTVTGRKPVQTQKKPQTNNRVKS